MPEHKPHKLMHLVLYGLLLLVACVVIAKVASERLYSSQMQKYQQLITAAGTGDTDSLRIDFEKGIDLNMSTPYKRFLLLDVGPPARFVHWTALHEAAVEGQVEAVKFLLDHGANAHAEAHSVCSQPLDLLFEHLAELKADECDKVTDYRTVVSILVKAGSLQEEYTFIKGRRAMLLARAVDFGDTEILLLLDPSGATGADRGYALESAAMSGRADFLDLLQYRDVPPDNLGRALAYAAARDDLKMVERLIEAGADVNSHLRVFSNNNYQDSPLHAAVQEGSASLVEFLLAKGADPRFRGESGKTPLESTNQEDKVQLLKKYASGNSNPSQNQR